MSWIKLNKDYELYFFLNKTIITRKKNKQKRSIKKQISSCLISTTPHFRKQAAFQDAYRAYIVVFSFYTLYCIQSTHGSAHPFPIMIQSLNIIPVLEKGFIYRNTCPSWLQDSKRPPPKHKCSGCERSVNVELCFESCFFMVILHCLH